MTTENKSYAFADSVWHNVIQIVQLAMLTGTDVADYLRQIRVEVSESDDLVLTDEYKVVFEKTLEQLTERMVELQAMQAGVSMGNEQQAPVVGSGPEDAPMPIGFAITDEPVEQSGMGRITNIITSESER